MPLLAVDCLGAAALPRGSLPGALAALPEGAPVVVMIHGYRFDPTQDSTSPHRHILSLAPDLDDGRMVSWPRHLGFRGGKGDEGLAIAFGWRARGTIAGAYRRAGRAGVALAALLAEIAALRPDLKLHLIAHSMGARVALGALARAKAGAVSRVILLAAAEFRAVAERAMETPAGRAAEVVNVTSRENDLFDFIMELTLAGGWRATLGHGLSRPRANWVDVQIDAPGTVAGLKALGHPVRRGPLTICHWSPYLRPGLFPLYRKMLRSPEAVPLALLRAHLPERPTRRWSRIAAQFWSPSLSMP